jgi:hypothetical protein
VVKIAEGGTMAAYDHSSLRLAHLMSQSTKVIINGTRTTSHYSTFPFRIEPPAEGVSFTEVFCGVCQTVISVEVSHDALVRPVRKAPLLSGIAVVALGAAAIAIDSSVGLVGAGFAAVLVGLGVMSTSRKSGFGVRVATSEPVQSRMLHAVLCKKA